jgi:hypothetical protein
MLLRTVLAIVTGYVVFAVSAVVLFHGANVDPHSPAGIPFEVFTVTYGLAFALLAGFIAGKIARRPDLVCGIGVALLIGLGATASMIARPGAGALWTQTAALLLFAPASFVGDWIRGKKMTHTVNQQTSSSAIEK